MDKTININLGGTLFQIDEEAYKILRDYLQSLDMKFRHIPGGNETIEDIESRIAEIFQSQKGTAGIISIENVVDMIRIIGKPEDFDLSGSETGIMRAGLAPTPARCRRRRTRSRPRVASPVVLPNPPPLPHLRCSPRMCIRGDGDGADQYGDTR